MLAHRPWLAILAMIGLGSANLAAAEGDDFRIQTRVFKGEEEAPVSQNLTLFQHGVVYDFLSEPAETTIFDRPRGEKPGRFVLLDPQRKLQTEVTLQQLQRFMSNLQLWAAGHSDAFVRFLATPDFKHETQTSSLEQVYRSRWMTYRMKASAEEKGAIFAQYDEFSDGFVRLNTMLTIKSQPPYGLARLAVNAALRSRREIPTEVTLEIESPSRFFRRRITWRSEHQLTHLLSQPDLARIAEAQAQLVSFPKVDLQQYLRPADED